MKFEEFDASASASSEKPTEGEQHHWSRARDGPEGERSADDLVVITQGVFVAVLDADGERSGVLAVAQNKLRQANIGGRHTGRIADRALSVVAVTVGPTDHPVGRQVWA